jgi:hypothetical protein
VSHKARPKPTFRSTIIPLSDHEHYVVSAFEDGTVCRVYVNEQIKSSGMACDPEAAPPMDFRVAEQPERP